MHPKHHAHQKHLAAMDSIPRGANLHPPQPDDIDPDQDPPGSRRIGDDERTLGGIPSAEARRARRESGGPAAAWADRPTRPLQHAAGDMPDGSPAPAGHPPSRERALDLARSFLGGPDAQRVVGRDGCEEMARYIRAQPDFVTAIRAMAYAELGAQRAVDACDPADLRRALCAYADAKYRLVMLADVPSPLGDLSGAFQARIDDWLLGTVAVNRMRRRSETPPTLALDRVDDAERGLGKVSSLDDRFRAELEDAIAGRRLDDVLALDPPTAATVTDLEILALARSFGDGTASDSDGRATCMIALGVCGPIPRRMEIIRGATREEVIAQARAWCVAKIHELAQASRIGSDPDPIDGPQRYRWAAPPQDRNRSRLARENAGLSVPQAAKQLRIDGETLIDIEANEVLYPDETISAMADLYHVRREWLSGDVPQRYYAAVDLIPGSEKLSPGDRDMLAEFAASLPRNGKTARERLAEVSARKAPAVAAAGAIQLDNPDGVPTFSVRSEVCASCHHQHAGPEVGRICIGCPCEERPGSDAELEAFHSVIDGAPRIFTPREDGSCAVCGNLLSGHNVDIDDGCPTNNLRSCPAVAP